MNKAGVLFLQSGPPGSHGTAAQNVAVLQTQEERRRVAAGLELAAKDRVNLAGHLVVVRNEILVGLLLAPHPRDDSRATANDGRGHNGDSSRIHRVSDERTEYLATLCA